MMEFKEIKTREEFISKLPIINQDPGDVKDDMTRTENFIVAVQNGYRQFAAYRDREIIAVVGMSKTYSPNYPAPACDIIYFVVDEKHRRKGIGSQCLEFCRKFASEDGASCLRLAAYAENKPVLDFYQKNGFKHTANFMFQSLDGSVG
jgi:ribosomal protein S18 acetylase RimI-like enzyme